MNYQAPHRDQSTVWRLLVLGACLFTGCWRLALGASLEIDITPGFSGSPIQPNSLRYQTSAGETFSITRVSFLISSFALQRADGSWLDLTNRVGWFDLEAGRLSLRVPEVPADSYRGLRFFVGLDEKLNHADPAEFPAEHPLNPNLNGLHWSWQGGYIFLAVEGMWRSAAVPAAAATDTNGSPGTPNDLAQSELLRLREPRAGASLDGWAYHLARDTNRTPVNLAADLNLAHNLKLELEFDLAVLLNAPRPLSFGKDGSSTHSRDADPIAAALVANLPGSFRVRRVSAASTEQIAAANPPLYLPEEFTPYRFQMSATFPVPDLPRDNPLIQERVALGEKLFHETALSRDGALSCASCHKTSAAFSDPRRYSVGVRKQVGTRNAMPLFNLAWKSSFFWDGRAPSLRAQALMPIQDHTEMDESLTNVVSKLSGAAVDSQPITLTPALSLGERGNISQTSAITATVAIREISGKSNSIQMLSPLPAGEGQGEGERSGNTTRLESAINYTKLFTAAFGSPEITAEKIGLALEQFLLTLTSFDSKFDRAIRGEEKLNADEQRGFELFMTEYEPRTGRYGADCFHCHGGPLFQSQTFANNGLDAEFKDPGRAKVTGKDSDRGKFATPSLRNVALTAPYMHDGRFATLEDVLEHYNSGLKRSATLDPNLAKHPVSGLGLSAADRRALVAFLKTLTDEKFSAGKSQLAEQAAKGKGKS